jgi:hypothetical protein
MGTDIDKMMSRSAERVEKAVLEFEEAVRESALAYGEGVAARLGKILADRRALVVELAAKPLLVSEDGKAGLARGVREERAAIVAFLRGRGFHDVADAVTRCEHAEDAVRLSLTRVDAEPGSYQDGVRQGLLDAADGIDVEEDLARAEGRVGAFVSLAEISRRLRLRAGRR